LETAQRGSLQDVVKRTEISRQLYYLRDVGEFSGNLDIPNRELAKVGWTKLAILAKYCEPGAEERGFELALMHSAERLPSTLKGTSPPRQKSHSILLRLTDAQYKLLSRTLLRFGAKPAARGKGIANKEIALIRALRAVPDK
jgi:hypothetical protein